MADRQRYWKLEPDEVAGFTYNESKMLNWEIKCTKDDGVSFVGAFAYKHGIPVEYESIIGVGLYHNNIDDAQKNDIVRMLKKKYGGSIEDYSNRIIVHDAAIPYSGPEICELGRELESMIDGKSIISLEFEGLTQDEQDNSGLPATKLLPVTGVHSGA